MRIYLTIAVTGMCLGLLLGELTGSLSNLGTFVLAGAKMYHYRFALLQDR
jgi:hypothetical protein